MAVTDQHPGPVVVICGGVGAARFLRGLVDVLPEADIVAVVNVADDMVLHGLSVSPDIDTITYTLADAIDPERGWGLRNETWNAMEALGRYGERDWFSLGDRDLGTHLQRTARLAEGATLTEVTAEIATAWDVGVRILPVTDDPLGTRVVRADTGVEVSFQEYFVGLRHDIPVSSVRVDGIDTARPTSHVLDAIGSASLIVIAPSNPIVSIAPVLDVAGVQQVIAEAPAPTVAVSPLVGGRALKGPAAELMTMAGHRSDAVGVASLWADLADVLVIDDQDASLAREVAGHGVVPYVTDTIMASPQRRAALAASVLSAARVRRRTPS